MNLLTLLARRLPAATPVPASIPSRIARGRRLRLALAVGAAAALAVGVALPAAAAVQSGRPARASHPPVAAQAVPAYYAALNNPRNPKSPDQVVVGDTLTGRRLATVSPPKGQTFGGVTGAADDRTFILDVRQFPWSSTYPQVTPRTFDLLKIAPGSGHPVTLTRLRIPATPNGAQVNGIAISPGGTEFAVMFQPGAWGPVPGKMTLQIYSAATGKLLHTWVGPAPGPGVETFGEYLYLDDNATLSWTANGRELAFVYGPQIITDTTVRLLSLSSPVDGLHSPGHGLLADSKLVLDLKSGAVPDCSSLLLTSDGRTIVCGASLPAGSGSTAGCAAAGPARPGIDEYSAATGRLTRVLYRYGGTCLDGRADALWANPSGATVLGYLGITQAGQGPSGVAQDATGVLTGGRLRPLPIRTAVGPPSAAMIAF